MGLFDWFRKLFMGGDDPFDDHFFQSDDQKKKNAFDAALEIGSFLGGEPKERDGGGEVHVSGDYDGRAIRVKFSVTFGGVEIQTKLAKSPGSLFLMMHDSDGQAKYVMSNEDKDDWDEGDAFSSRNRHWFSEHLYIEDDPEDLKKKIANYDKLSTELRSELTDLMELGQASLSVSRERLELSPWKGVLGRKDGVAVVTQFVQLAAKLGNAVEANWS